ncbi:MAG: antitoxin [Betaproteobacteria bacterium CG2_30_59_46]|nr:MAG: antitoxin [Betaproteobacteria bacterium CG2_30_59_46]PIQ14139.1 MAG: type II toxin-antitoxin system prevent-host-death family antitoxin [Hydrogenophilales bacterium CG18_big_fil_WC_8_21_14_2_50_58_12]PIY01292.1 MAG: type II toxin-antitoxin system prevent-host-death family antitoxin [Hydrogenophilales bacterium CG_4_10_14_3_um_filter_58_23]PJB03828.1 MAG: type II toxin-antitoxin system prevent-host-death family antitoxin [Hydrogenophilales bacterium CG_4_9_14_3_um_filter_59_35]
MQTINIHDAKTQFSKLIEAVSQGEEIIIAKAGKPAARLVPIQAKKPLVRKPGSLKGKIKIAEDFDAPLPNEIQSAFEGN